MFPFPLGAFYNALAIIFGGIIGIFTCGKFSEKYKTSLYTVIAVVFLYMGINMAMSTVSILQIIISLILGSISGQYLGIHNILERFGESLRKRFANGSRSFASGFVNSSVFFCVGAMSIVGALNEGIQGDRTLLIAKSVLDIFISMIFVSNYGVGVLFSSIVVFVYIGALTILSSLLGSFFSETLVNQLSALGGILVICIAINMADIKKIEVANLLPSFVFLVILHLLGL
ncbi:MAG: DUF554 domain-containing protein [Patescibacteria group bacterium]|jgi:hypothetical protein